MNFVYDPVQAAQLTAYVQYISPVKGVKERARQAGRRRRRARRQPDPVPERRGRRPAATSFADLPDDVDARDHRPLPRGSSGADGGRRRRRPTGRCAAGKRIAVPAVAARDAVPVPLLPRPAGHAAQDRAVDQARPAAARVRLHVGVGQLLHRPSPTSAASSCGRSPTPAIATVLCVADRLPDRLLHRLQGRASTATSCSGW